LSFVGKGRKKVKVQRKGRRIAIGGKRGKNREAGRGALKRLTKKKKGGEKNEKSTDHLDS